jgi:hypothetical protein
MENQDLNTRLTDNYLNQVKEYLKELITKGYVIFVNYDGNQSIYQYNVKIKDFVKSKDNIMDMVENIKLDIPNPFNVPIDTIKYMNMIIETFPAISSDDIDDFQKYNKAVKYIKSEKELKEQLKTLKQEIKLKNRKINPDSETVFEENQMLINAGIVVYVDRKKVFKSKTFYRFNKSNNRFDVVKAEEIKKLIEETFKTEIHIGMVEKRMKNEFAEYGIQSNLPYLWNRNIEYQADIKNLKNCKINKIAESYN